MINMFSPFVQSVSLTPYKTSLFLGSMKMKLTLPSPPQKCSTCGGDSKKKGFCNNEKGQGWMSDYYRCKQYHKEGCGLICECVSEETGKPG